ncbi:MAG: type II toxin-antitoxin system VapC family toxin [Terracidiphilus sp.]|jgi:predicted nucleic acid-binding protein
MILLDTNVISEFMGPAPGQQVAQWLDLQPRSSIWTTSINVYEIRSGLLAMQPGKRRGALEVRFEQLLESALQGRVLHFDSDSALRAAELCADRRRRGRPVDARDTMIAGIVLASRATLATRNVKHFEDIKGSVVNPWEKG